MSEIKDDIKEMNIVNDDGSTIFSLGKDRYIIPIYQRAFAWGDDEICQLINDIYDCDADHYYLGSLVVHVNKDGLYEVIDGQQRLTALFLLLNYIGYSWKEDRLCYECRDKSNYTLNNLTKLTGEFLSENRDKCENSILKGMNDIKNRFENDEKKIVVADFKEKLKKVKIFRIEVPKHTDLNRYFEIMNVRGEQLEQHDILKARLMKPLKGDMVKHDAFAIVWDACRDMTGYAQMHFTAQQREVLFGEKWNCSPDLQKLYDVLQPKEEKNEEKTDKLSAIEISKLDRFEQKFDGEDEEGRNVRFESVISFPYFLLHVLRGYMNDDSVPMDDKKLVETFKDAIKKKEDKKQFSLEFIQLLLKSRFLFDKYVIKREYLPDDKNGKWSLKELKNYNGKSQYIPTEFKNKNEWDRTYAKYKKSRQSNILMLQACLRVSITSPKSMNWITQTMKWLSNDGNVAKHSELESAIENHIRNEYIKQFIDKGDFMQGLETPHIVFHYLDYLLWKERENKYKELGFGNFVFEFRNSVEHWYPQHPSGGTAKPWEDKEEYNDKLLRDSFGNLCIVTRDVNSKFSNSSPTAKKTYDDAKEGSLKLRLMSKLTTDDTSWRDGDYKKHQDEMIELLESACNIK